MIRKQLDSNKQESERELVEKLIKSLSLEIEFLDHGQIGEPDIILNKERTFGIEVTKILDEKKLIQRDELCKSIEEYLNCELSYVDPKLIVQVDLSKLPLSDKECKSFKSDCATKLKCLLPLSNGEYSTIINNVPIKITNSNNPRIIVTGYISKPLENHVSYNDAIIERIIVKSKRQYYTKKTWLFLHEMTYRLYDELFYEIEYKDFFEKIKKIEGYDQFEKIYIMTSGIFIVQNPDIIEIIPNKEKFTIYTSCAGPIFGTNQMKINKKMEKKNIEL